ncbi:hypothetical protein Q4489_04125 [Thalassotalea sp. 1_MG-2023]|uniref:hypothetical protein n=1 Tax=Thalassotalea sp. 1_MG-2023 TaxID=3062680 RepID=UPI0026E1AEA5|nr:hypothetical protein [Thalassotalea sp. 1_MG-2023]MDO6426183.1 hypothetical protein [Thalassotalea sp. 1_MG-2023]
MKKPLTDSELQTQVAQLPKERTPERDLWPGIEKAIAQQSSNTSKRQSFYPVAWAASIVVAVVVSWLSLTPVTDVTEQQSLAKIMKQDFEQQKQLMLTSLGQPDLTQLSSTMKTQLIELQEAQLAIQKALAKDENNGDLLNLLRWTQKQELDLIKKLYSPQWQTI